jgi:preprotein translocase subunit SecE
MAGIRSGKEGKGGAPHKLSLSQKEKKRKSKKESAGGKEPKGAVIQPLKRPRQDAARKRFTLGEYLQNLRQFFNGVWQELKKVHWPSRREVVVYTGVVMVVVLIVMGILWIADSIFSQVLRLIIK